MTPYYQDNIITLYCGDAREILPQLDPVDVIYTDPIWPNCEKIFPGIDAWKLFSEAAIHFPRLAERVCVQLGVDSDPRFLMGVPLELPFFRSCWLEYPKPRYRGTLLAGNDVLYVFGKRYTSHGHRGVIPGYYRVSIISGQTELNHPCPRNRFHAAWVIENYTRQTDCILDPFSGSGTFLISAARAGRKSIGIEIEEKWCKETVRRIKSEIGLLSEMMKGEK